MSWRAKAGLAEDAPSWKRVSETMALAMPMPWPRKTPASPNLDMSAAISPTASMVVMLFCCMEEVCMITSRRESGLVTTT